MDEIAEMLTELEGTKKEDDKPEEPKEEPAAEEPVVEEPLKEEPAEEPPAKEQPAEEEPVNDVLADNIKLREQLNEMARRIGAGKVETPSPVAQEAGKQKEAVKAAVTEALADYITDEEADTLIDQPKKVITAVVDRAMKAIEEKIMRALPPIVGNVAQHHIDIYQQVDQFYKKNTDLEPYRDFVGLVGSQIEAENPDWTVPKLYEETAKVARARLGLRLQAEQKSEAKEELPGKPAFPARRSNRKPAGGPVLTEQQKEMVDLLNLD